jgi:Recombination endonuclease VII
MQYEKICNIHGELLQENIIVEPNKSAKRGYTLRCKLCKLIKCQRYREANREKLAAKSGKWKRENRDRANATERAYRLKYPEKVRERERNYKRANWAKISVSESLRHLGLKNEDYILMLQNQRNKCSICNLEETRMGRGGKICRLAIDHCHASGKIRALLCHSCNVGLGSFKDDISLMISAINYLEKHSQFAN